MSRPTLERLEALDARLLPSAARRVRAWADATERLRARLPQRTPVVEDEGLGAEAVPLLVRARALDARYARRGLLGFIAEVPQLGAALLALLLVIGAIGVVSRLPDRQPASSGQGDRLEGPDAAVGFTGIRPGAEVAPYLADAGRRLQRIAIQTPDASVVALVTFAAYVTPERAAELIGPARASTAYYAAAGPKLVGQTRAANVVNLAVDLRTQLAVAATSLEKAAADLEAFAKTIPGVNDDERQQKATSLRDATQFRAQARALRAGKTVFAVVARGPARRLAELAQQPGIRVVDPTPDGLDPTLVDFQPLRPEVTTVAPTAPPRP